MISQTHRAGWTRLLLAVIVLLCVFAVISVTASHVHLSSEGPGDVHCSLCLMGATLVAVVVGVAIVLAWFRARFFERRELELPGSVRFCVHSIRPPPANSVPVAFLRLWESGCSSTRSCLTLTPSAQRTQR
jgi:uncharacterized integral membrane protein